MISIFFKYVVPVVAFCAGIFASFRWFYAYEKRSFTNKRAEFLKVRQFLKAKRSQLTKDILMFYKNRNIPINFGLLVANEWLIDTPIPIDKVRLNLISNNNDKFLLKRNKVLPYSNGRTVCESYSEAINLFDRPDTFDDRVQYRLLDFIVINDSVTFDFSKTKASYFDKINYGGLLEYEFTTLKVLGNTQNSNNNKMRLKIKNPCKPFNQIKVLTGISTLTLLKKNDSFRFLMHQRGKREVGFAMGTSHVIPAGEFQPSNISPMSFNDDFSLWLNIMREYAEEIGLMEEHDGTSGTPFNYSKEPFNIMENEKLKGNIKPLLFGFGLDPLSLQGEILTVVIFNYNTFAKIFPNIITQNTEGKVITEDGTWGMPFTKKNVTSFLNSNMIPSGQFLLETAFDKRDLLMKL